MNVQTFSDAVLLSKTLEAAENERSATLFFLEYLGEIDKRRLYSARGYSSLWEYVHKALGYSEGQASERVSAMRLMRRVPEVRAKLEANTISLTATSKLATFVRRENCGPTRTRDLLEMISEKPTREVERILAAEQTVDHPKPDIARPSGPKTTRISFDADPEFLALYEELRNLQGRPDWSMNDRLKAVLRLAVLEKSPKSKSAPGLDSKSDGKAGDKAESNVDPKISSKANGPSKRSDVQKHSRYVPVAVRAATYQRSAGRCEFVDPQSGRRCESRFGLQLDHVNPYAKGGDSSAGNIRHLCASHNRFYAIREFGLKAVLSRSGGV
jgi:hypothetical protein